MCYNCVFVKQRSGRPTAELSEDQRQRVKRLVSDALEKALTEAATQVT